MRSPVYSFITTHKYEALLLSLLLMLFGDLLIPTAYASILDPFLIIQNIIVSLVVFNNRNNKFKIGLVALLVLITVLEFLIYFTTKQHFKMLMFFFFIIYFITISFRVYAAIYKSRKIGAEMIAAVFCGFIMMVTIGSFMFVILEMMVPNSFSNLGAENEIFSNIQYFSFITSLTIGYGDIAPLTEVAKKSVMLLGITGNFYSVFVTGIVIGKFINTDRK